VDRRKDSGVLSRFFKNSPELLALYLIENEGISAEELDRPKRTIARDR
jgi:hypothetical protein